MGNASSNITQITPTVSRSVFFPGNLISGTVFISCKDDVEYNSLSINLEGELMQSFQVRDTRRSGRHGGGGGFLDVNSNMARREVKMNLGETGCTIIGSTNNSKNNYNLSKGNHTFEWAFMLPPRLLPSAKMAKSVDKNAFIQLEQAGGETANICYYVTSSIEISGKSAKQSRLPIVILMPIAAEIWQRPSAITRPCNMDLVACFCCQRGKLQMNCGLSKSVVALDVDSISYDVAIDATQSEEPVENMTVSLIASVNIKSGQRPISFSSEIFSNKVRCGVQAGKNGNVRGNLQLGANRPPTIQSSVIDISYKVRFDFDFEFAASSSTTCDVFVAHSVDSTNACLQLQQMHQQIQAGGRQEVPNLLNPLYQQYRPPAFENMQMQPQMQQQQQQQYQQQPQPQYQQHQHHHHHQAHHHHHQQMAPMPPQQHQQHHHQHHQQQFAHHHQHQQQQQYQQQPPPPQQQNYQPEQYDQTNFSPNQQFMQSPPQDQFNGIAAYPSAQLTQQAQA